MCYLLLQSPIIARPDAGERTTNCLFVDANTTHAHGKTLRGVPLDWSVDDAARRSEHEGVRFFANEDHLLPAAIARAPAAAKARWLFVTVLRDPVARLASHFAFEHLATRASYTSPLAWAHRATYWTVKHYVRVFAGIAPDDCRPSQCGDPHYNLPARAYDLAGRTVDRSDLARAETVLREVFAVVIILEDFDETVPLLRLYLGVDDTDQRPRDWTRHQPRWDAATGSTAPVSRGVSNETELAELRRLNALDVELYEAARRYTYCNLLRNYVVEASASPSGAVAGRPPVC